MYDFIGGLTQREVRAAGATPELAADALIAWERKRGSLFTEPSDAQRRALIDEVREYGFTVEHELVTLPDGRPALMVRWPVVAATLGHEHRGLPADDAALVDALIKAGAPEWIRDAEGVTDEDGWYLIDDGDRITDEHNRLNARAHDPRLSPAERQVAMAELNDFDRKHGIQWHSDRSIRRAEDGYADA